MVASAGRSASADASQPLGLTPRTVFVTGKGGVGKSTVAVALATAWRDAGARTLLVEIEGHASAASLLSDRPIGYEPVPVGERLAAMRITLIDALREYARLRLKVRVVADRLVGNQVIDQFAQAAPGFRDLLVLGKLWWLASAADSRGRPTWDAIVVDAPATGHGLGLLGMAGTIAKMFPVGPIAAQATAVDAFVRDSSRVGVVLVSLPEELPVTETLELRSQLDERGIYVAAEVLNCLLVDRFSTDDVRVVRDLHESANTDMDPAVRHALATVVWEHEMCVDQAQERARLDAGLKRHACLLPFMFAPQLGSQEVTTLGQWLLPHGQEVLRTRLAGAADGPAAASAFHASTESAAAALEVGS